MICDSPSINASKNTYCPVCSLDVFRRVQVIALTSARYARRMEDLREKVYECTFAFEAHMICDLLARAGISSRVDGEFLAGAIGELPLGSAIKVRVDPSRTAEAREVIDEWERLQPPPEPNR